MSTVQWVLMVLILAYLIVIGMIVTGRLKFTPEVFVESMKKMTAQFAAIAGGMGFAAFLQGGNVRRAALVQLIGFLTMTLILLLG